MSKFLWKRELKLVNFTYMMCEYNDLRGHERKNKGWFTYRMPRRLFHLSGESPVFTIYPFQ
jgi:hypothetical protein